MNPTREPPTPHHPSPCKPTLIPAYFAPAFFAVFITDEHALTSGVEEEDALAAVRAASSLVRGLGVQEAAVERRRVAAEVRGAPLPVPTLARTVSNK